jgi:uncharacterized protein
MIATAPLLPPWDDTCVRRNASLLVPVALLVVAFAACRWGGSSTDTGSSGSLVIHTADADATLSVEIADTPDERATGLMDRESLPADAGMAFVWDEPVDASFWMKDTLIPLSIAFWDEQGRIVAIVDMQPCRTDPCPTYSSPEPYVGAVEANLGWFGRHGAEVDDLIELEANA